MANEVDWDMGIGGHDQCGKKTEKEWNETITLEYKPNKTD